MNRMLRCIVAPAKFLSAVDKSGIDVNMLEYPNIIGNILSGIDLEKYNKYVYNNLSICATEIKTKEYGLKIEDGNEHTVSIDSISKNYYIEVDHYDPLNPLCNTDVSIFTYTDDYKNNIATAPLLYKIAGDGLLLVSLLQYDISNNAMKKLHQTAWYNFYKSLLDANVNIRDLAKNITFNYYINMTNG